MLLDDRKVSPGVKFKDAELIGMPTIVVVGRALADGVVEVRDRASGARARWPSTTRSVICCLWCTACPTSGEPVAD